MDKAEAIREIKKIQSGDWKRNEPEPPKGNVAAKMWEDSAFAYGMEYGAIVALMQAFDITAEDLK